MKDAIDFAVSEACREIRETLLRLDAQLGSSAVAASITVNRHGGNDWAVFASVDTPGATLQ